ncbi:aminotransferase class V-fold PLP-dependent enzyme, partial [bacterium]|nr:aminotransferase class V-fold PLP-dependent enzyme [bacterium]
MLHDAPIYLDYNATAPLLPEAREAMREMMSANFGNASSRHSIGQRAWKSVEDARESVAAFVDAHPDEVIFTSGATESNFLSLLGRFDFLLEEGRMPDSIRIAYSPVEHPCVIAAIETLQNRGAQVAEIPVDQFGRVKTKFFSGDSNFDIVAVMAANHETGVIQPIQKISEHLDPGKTYFHCDAVQWAGRGSMSFKRWNFAALSLSAHKFGGPKGVGALILRSGTRIVPQIPGSQEAGLRGGTTNSLGIAGFGAAAQAAHQNLDASIIDLTKKREHFWKLLKQSVPAILRTLPEELSVCNTLHVRFPGI